MKPAPFDYVRAGSLAEALAVLAEEGAGARIIAGGQTLMPMLAMRLARPKVLVDIMRIAELRGIRVDSRGLRVGAGTRQAELLADPDLSRTQPLLAAALPWVGHAQTRSRGTVCGSIAHADPSAEIPLVLLALGGDIHLRGRKRARVVPAADYFTGLLSTAKGDDELIEAVTFPAAEAGTGHAFAEFGRRHGDFAICACAAVVRADSIRLAVGGVADRPVAADWPGSLDGSALDDALDAFAWSLEARDDMHATARHRRDLVRGLGRRVIEEARRCRA